MLDSIFSSSRSALLLQERLDLASFYLETASKAKDRKIALVLCDDAEASLSELKKAVKKAHAPETIADQTLRDKIATVYCEHSKVLEKLGQHDRAQASYKKAQKWGHQGIKPAPTVPAVSLSVHSPALSQTVLPASSAEEKSDLVDYLFEKALLTLSSLEVANKPSLFLVYAHDNDAHGEAKASTSKYLINNLSKIRGVTLYSDQTPIGQAYSSSAENLKEDGKLEDILTNQFCLLPAQVRADVKPVDKVIVCCSDVLGSYLKGQSYKAFCDELKKAYDIDREAYVKDNEQKGTPALREVVRKFSQEEKYASEFHHVLTEMAFLEIRAAHLQGQHGIIPVSLTPNSYDYCLKDFIDSTTVRMEDPLRFDLQVKKGEEVYLNQGSHGVLFKVIERLLAGSNESKTFLDKFWTGHSNVISRLKSDSNFGKLEFAKLLDGIFDDIRTALHKQLASTVQQEHEQLQVFRADPRSVLKKQYFDVLKQDAAFQKTLQLYVAPHGKASLEQTATFNLLPKVQNLLNDKKVILLTGDSGAGKTTFNRVLEKELWDQKKESDAIPLFIALPSIDKPEHDLIAKALKKRGLSAFQIQKLKKEKQPFVFILDGYDEIRQTQNLYLHNRINQPDGWQGQMVISCRSEYLGQDYRSRFQPDPTQQGEDASFQEVVIAPFSEAECHQYLEKYVRRNPVGWTVEEYQAVLEKDEHLKALVSNPFLLHVVLEALPYLDNEEKARSAIQLRLDLYGQFVRLWFERNQQRLSAQNLTGIKKELFSALSDEGFAEHGIAFMQALAVQVYIENAGKPIIDYSSLNDKGNWKEAFFGSEGRQQLLREACPLNRNGTQYRFIHKSLLEYSVAQALFESFDACSVPNTHHRRDSNASVYSFENQPVLLPQKMRDLSLAPKHWIGDLGVVRLLTDRVGQEPSFKKQLLAIIKRSRTDPDVRQAAANAITILARAGFSFIEADLPGIRIGGADLSYGLFDHAQFAGADLRKVNFQGAWLRGTDFSGAQMDGVRFGEKPSLLLEHHANDCCYSLDGRWLAVAAGATIKLYDAHTRELIRTFEEPAYKVTSVVFSPDGTMLAAGSGGSEGSEESQRSGGTVSLWSVEDEKHPLKTFERHIYRVESVVFSPDGTMLASASGGTVDLWSVGNEKHPLKTFAHTNWVTSVAFSPDGKTLASANVDQTVKLWSIEDEKGPLKTFEGHTHCVTRVVFSPDGKTLASASMDQTVKLWSVENEKCPPRTFEGHTNLVLSATFSPDGKTLASASWDYTVKLWSVADEKFPPRTFEGHSDWVTSVVFSPDGKTLASGSVDYSVKLWSVAHEMRSLTTLEGHTDSKLSMVFLQDNKILVSGSKGNDVKLWSVDDKMRTPQRFKEHTEGVAAVMFSRDGKMLASGSNDQTVKLWSIDGATCPPKTFNEHIKTVSSVAFSPDLTMLASGSGDHTVKLWSVHDNTHSLKTFAEHSASVMSVVFSPSGKTLASGSWDRTVKLWSVDGETRSLKTFKGHAGVTSTVFSPDGTKLASGSGDGTINLWSVGDGAGPLKTFGRHTSYVTSVAFSPDGKILASGGHDKTTRLWSVDSGQLLNTIQSFNGTVHEVAWQETSEGNWLVTGCGDKSVRVWQLKQKGKQLRVILRWTSMQAVLTAHGASIQNVLGLNSMNAELLKQRGAVGEPSSRSREANQELTQTPGIS